MKPFVTALKEHTRLIIQTAFFLYTIGIGARFYYYYKAVQSGDYTALKPGGVEGFLPISALLGLKQLLTEGVYDYVHPAGLTILLAAILISTIFKKGFCGYICPVGFLSERISSVGFGLRIPKYIHYPLLGVKYILLGFFVYFIFYKMNGASVTAFINSPYNKISDAKMLDFFLSPSFISITVVCVILILTLVFKNVWCRYLCPYGAFLGIFSLLSPFKIKRNKEACISCNVCGKVCPMDIKVYEKKTVITPECMGCMTCIKKRNNPDCLSNGYFSSKPYIYALLPSGLFIIIFIIAYFSGFWTSSVSNEEYGYYLKAINAISH